MQTPQNSSFLSRVKLRWQNSWFTERVEITDGAMGACQQQKVQQKIALFGIIGLLVGQTILPGAMLISNVQAAELRIEDRKQAEAKAIDANTPAWAKMLEVRTKQEKRERELRLLDTAEAEKAGGGRALLTQGNRGGKNDGTGFGRPPVRPVPGSKPGDVVPSADLECVDCEVDVRALDLTRVPTEKELRRAGQLGGALTPTRRAHPEELGLKLDRLMKKAGVEGGLRGQLPPRDPRERGLQRAKASYARAQAINLDFGKAIQEWNKHNYRQAAGMFKAHIEKYPESPWAGEAELHLGCDAKYNGRFAEAQTIYNNLLKKSSDKPNQELKQKKQERKGRGGALSDAEINADVERAAQADSLEAAVIALDSATPADDESFDIHMKAKLRWADLDLATGRFEGASEKLANIIQTDTDWRRITWAQHWLRNIGSLKRSARDLRACGPRALGAVLVSLGQNDKAAQVRKLKGLTDDGYNVAQLEQLARRNGVVMRGFRAQKPEQLVDLPLPLILHYDFSTTKANRGFASKSPKVERSGHYMVMRAIDADKKQVTLFDPLEERVYTMTFSQLQREWSGKGLVLEQKGQQGIVTRLAALTKSEKEATVGGCCGLPSAPDDTGDSDNNEPPCRDGCGGEEAAGNPTVSFNKITMNMFIKDTPVGYKPAIGPPVDMTIAYNSQDPTTQFSPFGNKWSFRFASYLVEDTAVGGGRVTVFMGDGRQDNYTPDGNGGYNRRIGVFHNLVK